MVLHKIPLTPTEIWEYPSMIFLYTIPNYYSQQLIFEEKLKEYS